MSDFLYSAPTAPADIYDTELNALANEALGGQRAAALDNTVNRHPFANFSAEFSSALNMAAAVNPALVVYLIPLQEDSANYADTTEQHAVARLAFDEAASQQYGNAYNIPIGPFMYAIDVRNRVDQSLPATDTSTIAVSTHTGGTP